MTGAGFADWLMSQNGGKSFGCITLQPRSHDRFKQRDVELTVLDTRINCHLGDHLLMRIPMLNTARVVWTDKPERQM